LTGNILPKDLRDRGYPPLTDPSTKRQLIKYAFAGFLTPHTPPEFPPFGATSGFSAITACKKYYTLFLHKLQVLFKICAIEFSANQKADFVHIA